MATQSNIHFYVNWAKERLDEMEAGLASPEDKVGGEGILQKKQMGAMATQS